MLISDWSSDVGSSDLFAALLDSGAYMKYHAVGVILLGIIASIFGRSFASEPPAGTLAREEGFVDIVLPIASQRVSSDNSLTVVGRGKIEGKAVDRKSTRLNSRH